MGYHMISLGHWNKYRIEKLLPNIKVDFIDFPFEEKQYQIVKRKININKTLASKIFNDMEFKQKVLELKYKFMTQSDALIHGDLHTGSIMLNKKETYIIDPEFAFVGPFGFDIGA